VFIACLAATELAQAEEPEPVALEYAPPGPRDPSAYNHDGFFLRMGLGFGPGWTDDYNGLTANVEFLLGGTLGSGFVLGAGLNTHTMLSPADDVTALQLGSFALFATWYPDPRAGLNVQTLLGYGQLRLYADQREQDIGDVVGLVLGGGVGYDLWVAKQWSLGPAARLTYGSLGDAQNGAESHESWVSASLSLVATYH